MATAVVRKLRTLVKNPSGVRSRYSKQLCHFWAKHNLRRVGCAGLFDNRPREAIAPNWADLWFLYKTVRQRSPKVIVEFGSGCSTIILARALLDSQIADTTERHLLSIDASRYWLDATYASMPEHLRKLCTFVYSPVEEVEFHGIRGFRHTQVPAVEPNFLYLDGPALTKDRQVATDVLEMEKSFPQDFYMVVDGREIQCRFLNEELKYRYRVKHNKILYNTTFERV